MQEHDGVWVCGGDSLNESALALRKREISPVSAFRTFIVDHHHGGGSAFSDLDSICNLLCLACGSDPCKTDVELCVGIWRSKASASGGSKCKWDGFAFDQINPKRCGEETIFCLIEARSAAEQPSGICAQLLADCQASLAAIHLDLDPVAPGNRRNQVAFPDLGYARSKSVLCHMVDVGCANLRVVDDAQCRVTIWRTWTSCRSCIVCASQVCECQCRNRCAIGVDARGVERLIDAMC